MLFPKIQPVSPLGIQANPVNGVKTAIIAPFAKITDYNVFFNTPIQTAAISLPVADLMWDRPKSPPKNKWP